MSALVPAIKMKGRGGLFFTLVLILLGFTTGCTYRQIDDLPAPCDTSNVTFSAVVGPIMAQSCALSGCHDAATRSAGYDLSSYMGAKMCAHQGRLLGAIRHEPGYSPMPKGGGKLDSCDIVRIEYWINHGMTP